VVAHYYLLVIQYQFLLIKMSTTRSTAAIQVDIASVQDRILDAYRAALGDATEERLWVLHGLMVSNEKVCMDGIQ
jgi:hypothetical protein